MDPATQGENDDRDRGPKEEVEKRTTQRAPQRRTPEWNQEPHEVHTDAETDAGPSKSWE